MQPQMNPSNPSQPQGAPVTAPAASSSAPAVVDEKEQKDKGTVLTQDDAAELKFNEIMDLYRDARQYIDNGHRENWDNYFKVYKGKRVYRNYDGISDPVIRESHTIIETLVSNIASGTPKFHFTKTNEEQSEDTDVLNGLLDYYMLCNQMGLKNQQWVREMLLYGTGILHITWRNGKPWIENIPLRDFFMDPTATGLVLTLNPAEYAGFEYYGNKRVMAKTTVYDPEQDKYVPKYKNLEEAAKTPVGKDGKTMDKDFKDNFKNSTLGEAASKNQMHVIILYHLPSGRIYEIGNKKEVIYSEPTWAQRDEISEKIKVMVDDQIIETERKLDAIEPFLPFAVLRDYVDTSQFLGEGEMAVIIHDAELLNDLEAMDIDNNAYQNTPMYWIDPQFADLAPEIETIPGAVYPIPRNAMGALERPQLTGDLDNKKERVMARMRRATAADEAVQGVSQSSSRTTATEVSTQLAQAQTRFSTKISNLESEGYAQLGGVIFKLVQIFVTRKQAVRIVGKQGVYFKDFDPWEFNGEYEAAVELDTTIKQKEMEVGQKMNQNFALINNDPNFNQIEVKRWMMQYIDPTLTDERFNEMLAPPQAEKEDSKDIVTINYKDATPFTKYQMEIKAGFKPDPSHLADAQTRMIQQANEQTDALDPITGADGNIVPGLESMINNEQGSDGMSAAPQGAGALQPA